MDAILPWFALKSVPGVGNHLFKRLIDRFKSPSKVFQARETDLLEIDGMSPRLASAVKRHNVPMQVKADLERTVQKGYRIVTMTDADYPMLLREIPDPPPYLYVFGQLDGSMANIAVVGSRNATGYGISTTKRLCRDLAAIGMTVASGMAVGIDTAAHQGALSANGRTIAVLGSGFDNVYPAENRELFYDIARNGAVITELPLAAVPEPHHFPARNRIISGISLGTVVVEATRKSGSLITAKLAAEQNREVFAVPGSVQSFKSMGTHSLIKQGAKLVEHARDIMDELSHMLGRKPAGGLPRTEPVEEVQPLSPEEQRVLETLDPYPIHIDDIVRKLALAPGILAAILLQLELKGYVTQMPGNRFRKISDE